MSSKQKNDRLHPVPQEEQEQPEIYGMTRDKGGHYLYPN